MGKRRSGGGSITVGRVIGEYGNFCYICGGTPTTKDHIIPLARGGADSLANLRPCCNDCNSLKAALFLHEFILKYRGRLRPGFDFDIVGEKRQQQVNRIMNEHRIIGLVDRNCAFCGEPFKAILHNGQDPNRFCSARHRKSYKEFFRLQRKQNPILVSILDSSDAETRAVVFNTIRGNKSIIT